MAIAVNPFDTADSEEPHVHPRTVLKAGHTTASASESDEKPPGWAHRTLRSFVGFVEPNTPTRSNNRTHHILKFGCVMGDPV